MIAARFLRNDRKHKVPVEDGVCNDKRVQFFTGSDLLEALKTAKIPKTPTLAIAGDQDKAITAAKGMMSLGLFYQAQEIKSKYHDHMLQMTPSQKVQEDGLYIWVLSPTLNYWYSFGLVAVALFICLIKVWPLWLKIAVWWVSLIMLVSILSIIALRLVLWILFLLVGYRDIWLLPDFLDDHVGIMEAMTPLFGRGHIVEAKLRKKAEKEAKKLGKPVSIPEPDHRFGAANLAGILFCGLILCYKLGMFKGENIPDFLAGRDEIWNNYAFLLDETAYTPTDDDDTTPTPEQPAAEPEEEEEFNMDDMIDEDIEVDMDDLMDEEEDDLDEVYADL